MTTTPIGSPLAGLVPGQAGQTAGQPGTSGSTGDTFLALVQGLLDGAAAQPATDGLAAGTLQGVPTTTDLLETAGTPAEDVDLAAPAVDVAANPLPDLAAAAAAGVVPVLTPLAFQVQPVVQDPTAPTTAAVEPESPAPSAGVAPSAELPDVAVTGVEHRPATSDQATTPAAPTASSSSSSVAQVSGPAPLTSAATVSSAPTDTHRVTSQVFPEVVRVSTNPDGPQRMTIKLNPEALGEVRVVLTSRRDGGLEVSLAAGSDARTALTEGAPELQRLLDAAGRTDSRIVVRDLFGATVSTNQPAAAPSGTGVPTDLAGGAGNGAGRPGGDASGHEPRNHATGSNTATDGTPGTTNPSQPTDSVTRARTGLDVTM